MSPLFCAACSTLFAPPEDADPFALLGLEPAIAVDAGALRKELLRLQRAMHPDFFAGAADETRALAERNTAELNAAYEVLEDEVRRADWLVKRQGGPDENEERQMPQAFLMEVMEWNETLEEARGSEPSSSAREAALELGRELDTERESLVRSVAELLDPLPNTGSDVLVEARRRLNAVRYVDRALRQIEEIRLECRSSSSTS